MHHNDPRMRSSRQESKKNGKTIPFKIWSKCPSYTWALMPGICWAVVTPISHRLGLSGSKGLHCVGEFIRAVCTECFGKAVAPATVFKSTMPRDSKASCTSLPVLACFAIYLSQQYLSGLDRTLQVRLADFQVPEFATWAYSFGSREACGAVAA